METTYFKMIGQKSGQGKMILMAVVDADFIGEVPSIFEVQCIKMPSTVYTGTYPQIKINIETIKDRTEDLNGMGAAGILTEDMWYQKKTKTKDLYGISIDKK